MAKPVSMRPHYRGDAAFLLRLESAIMLDDRQTEDWRRETAAQARSLSVRLLSAKMDSLPEASAPQAVAKNGSKSSSAKK